MNLSTSVLFCFLSIMASCGYMEAPYAQWAHSHVVWLNGHHQDQSSILQLVQKYQSYGIEVGGVNIDSGWSTQYNNFQWNYKKFPHPQNIIDHFHEQGIKVMLWVTSAINNDTQLYKEGVKKGYFLNKGKVVKWWHGHGGMIDYFNPQAVRWWHSLMDKVLDMGIDGFKCDGADPLIFLLRPWPYSPHAKRYIGLHEYGHKYYGDFYNYTKSKNPQALIMSRPTDFYNTASWNYSPKYMMFSGWVGDQDSSAEGFRSAMSGILLSAWNNYLNFGFDIGGYRGQSISKNIFIRYFQVGALLPFMENGGNGRHAPWQFDQETVKIYKDFVDLHYKLKPTFLTAATAAFRKKKSVIKPVQRKRPAALLSTLNTFGYVLCDKLLVFPIFEENGVARMIFPKGKWYYYFNPQKVYNGGTDTALAFNLKETPLFMRNNSMIALMDQIYLVDLERGVFEESFIYGKYSEDVVVNFNESYLSIKVQRFYRDSEAEVEFGETHRKFKLIGMNGFKTNEVLRVELNGQTLIRRQDDMMNIY